MIASGLSTAPLTHTMRVPEEPATPRPANQAPPLVMIWGMLHRVSTLLTTVGQLNTPLTAGKGGLMRGYARLPSRDSISPVSSPQM